MQKAILIVFIQDKIFDTKVIFHQSMQITLDTAVQNDQYGVNK